MIAKKYYEALNLKRNPFSLLPSPDMFYMIDSQMEAMDVFTFALENDAPMVRIYGEPGVGKTALLRYMLGKLKERYATSYIHVTPLTDTPEFIKDVFNLNERPEENTKSVLDRCIENTLRKDIKRIVVVDEAQDMSRDLFLISKYIIDRISFEGHEGKVFFVFSGTQEMKERFESKDMKSLAQRCPFSFDVKGMRKKETKGYIEFRLRKCDYKGSFPFTDKAINLIWKFSKGNPRKVNILSERSLLASIVKRKSIVEKSEVKEALKDIPEKILK